MPGNPVPLYNRSGRALGNRHVCHRLQACHYLAPRQHVQHRTGCTRANLNNIGLAAFADGFVAAGLLAAVIAAIACLLMSAFVRSDDTAPGSIPMKERPRKSTSGRLIAAWKRTHLACTLSSETEVRHYPQDR
jgi:hypothetical protein